MVSEWHGFAFIIYAQSLRSLRSTVRSSIHLSIVLGDGTIDEKNSRCSRGSSALVDAVGASGASSFGGVTVVFGATAVENVSYIGV